MPILTLHEQEHPSDQTLHVQRLGTPGAGPVVVFLHGLVMDNLSSWYFTLAPRVAGHHEVLLYDLRGHGRSGRPSMGYRVRDHVEDFIALTRVLGLQGRRFLLVGNSFGGLLGAAIARAMPDSVAGLVLVDGQIHDAGWGERMAATLSTRGADRLTLIAENFAAWRGRHSARKRTRLERQARALVEGTSLIDDLRASPAPTPEEEARLTCPVLGLYGENSDVRARATAWAARHPSAELSIYPGCTHSILWEQTERLCQQVDDWVMALR